MEDTNGNTEFRSFRDGSPERKVLGCACVWWECNVSWRSLCFSSNGHQDEKGKEQFPLNINHHDGTFGEIRILIRYYLLILGIALFPAEGVEEINNVQTSRARLHADDRRRKSCKPYTVNFDGT
jgi:hypothetical protein